MPTLYWLTREQVLKAAVTLGPSTAMGYQIAPGRANVPNEVMSRLAALYNINLHWFLTGIGPSGLDAETIKIELLDQEAAAGPGRKVEDYAARKTVNIPLTLVRPCRPDILKAVYVSGDSIIDEKTNDGDVVVFSIDQGNGIYIMSIDLILLVKRVDFDDPHKTITLISANPAYHPLGNFPAQNWMLLKLKGNLWHGYTKHSMV